MNLLSRFIMLVLALGVAASARAVTDQSVSGYVYCQTNTDGIKRSTEFGIPGVKVTLIFAGYDDNLDTQSDVDGTQSTNFVFTAADGSYSFTDLEYGLYRIIETQPPGYLDGQDTVGSAGGTNVSNDTFDVYLLAAHGTNYNFGELKPLTVSCPPPVTVSCTSQVPPPDITSVTTGDSCCGTVTVTFVGDVISGQTCENRYTITRTYKATDGCNNSATCDQIITVNDITPPTITCPPPVTVSCASEVPGHDAGSISASDNCGGTVTVTHVGDVVSGQTCANRYTITRTYKATDVCGNSTTCDQIITVNDLTPPTITCPPTVTVSCASQVPAHDAGSISASDNCGGTVTVTHEGDAITGQTCANRYTITRTYKATDVCGNSTTCEQIITVNDTTPPTITCPPTVTVSCASQVPLHDAGNVSASDNCGGNVTVTHVGDVISGQTCANRFTITRTYQATDACGNTATCTQIITVNDTTAPTITHAPAGGQLGCNATLPSDESIKSQVVATDDCGVTISVSHVDGGTACSTNRTFTITASDGCNTSATRTIVYTADCTPCVSSIFNLNGNTALSGASGNIRTFTTNGISVRASAFSRNKSDGSWATAYLGSYGGGLGVTDHTESTGANNTHTVDNIDRDNYVLFEFSQPILLNRANLGYVVTDSDLSLWIGTFTDPFNNHLVLNDAVLGSFGYTENNPGGSTTRWADVNSGGVFGNAIVIAAQTGEAYPTDQFKISLLDVCKPTCTPLTLACPAGSAQIGAPYNSSLVASGGTPPYTFSIITGSLPPGLALNPSTGAITGTPTTPGTFSYTAQVASPSGMATATCSITIPQPVQGCTLTIGYYKNHPTAIAPLPIYLGTVGGAKTLIVSSQSIGVNVLGQHTYGAPANGITKLYAQLLAAKLNKIRGANGTAVASAISSADAFLATHNHYDWNSLTTAEKNSVLAWHASLDNYNNGVTGPGHCGDTECARALAASGTAASGQVKLIWKASKEATSYKVGRSLTPAGPYTIIKTGLTTTNYTDVTVLNGTVYYYVISAIRSGVEATDSDEVSAMPSAALPNPWKVKDIGAVVADGGSSYGSGKFSVASSGADIWGTSDKFRYVYQTANGDCTIVARVASIGNSDPWAKAGIMIRETLTEGSKNAAAFITPANGLTTQARTVTGGSTVNLNVPGPVAPYWLKGVRTGSTFKAYYSANGTTWTLMATQTITMTSGVHIGLAVSSHNDGVFCTAVFDNVTATP